MSSNIHIIAFVTLFLFRFVENKIYTVETQEMAQYIEEGRNQYNLLEQRSNIPQYGTCWKASVTFLHEGCRRLTENTQSDIALKFTDCFLKMSGLEPYECETSLTRQDCIKNMSDRAFNAYTEFYTHTHNICFFLQSQIWHEETEKTIERLSTSSAHVTKQLEEAETVQALLLQQQKESMSVQQELLSNGYSLSEVLHSSQENIYEIMHEFRTSTLEQRRILFEVFDRLTSLQAWAVGEISWLDTIVFYISSIIISYIITSTPRTYEARLWIFLIITMNVVIERFVVTNVLRDNVDTVDVINENLYWWIWQCRKVMIALCAIWIGVAVYRFCDYNAINHRLLLDIHKQNLDVINCLQKLRETNTRPKFLTEKNRNSVLSFQRTDLAEPINVLPRMQLQSDKSSSPSPSSTRLIRASPMSSFQPADLVGQISTLQRMQLQDDRSSSPAPSSSRVVRASPDSSFEPVLLTQPIVVLPRMQLRPNMRSSSPALSSVSVNTNKSGSSSTNTEKKRQTSRRMMEIRTPSPRYSLRSTPTPSPSVEREIV